MLAQFRFIFAEQYLLCFEESFMFPIWLQFFWSRVDFVERKENYKSSLSVDDILIKGLTASVFHSGSAYSMIFASRKSDAKFNFFYDFGPSMLGNHRNSSFSIRFFFVNITILKCQGMQKFISNFK